jgi:hypothetical protein
MPKPNCDNDNTKSQNNQEDDGSKSKAAERWVWKSHSAVSLFQHSPIKWRWMIIPRERARQISNVTITSIGAQLGKYTSHHLPVMNRSPCHNAINSCNTWVNPPQLVWPGRYESVQIPGTDGVKQLQISLNIQLLASMMSSFGSYLSLGFSMAQQWNDQCGHGYITRSSSVQRTSIPEKQIDALHFLMRCDAPGNDRS